MTLPRARAYRSAWLLSGGWLMRLRQRSKHHLIDPALARRLLNTGTGALLEGAQDRGAGSARGVVVGVLFESLVTQSVPVYGQHCEARVQHLRLKGRQREIDLIFEWLTVSASFTSGRASGRRSAARSAPR